MANVQHPGFLPHSKGSDTVELRRCIVLSNNTDAIARGDALDTASGGVIAHTTEDGEVYSVAMGVSYYSSTVGGRIERTVLPAATTYSGTAPGAVNTSFCYAVADTQAVNFRASIDEAIVAAGLNDNYNMVLTVATGTQSAHELDATSAGTTATNPWRVLEFILDDPKVDHTLADAHVICKVNAGRRDPALEPGGTLGSA